MNLLHAGASPLTKMSFYDACISFPRWVKHLPREVLKWVSLARYLREAAMRLKCPLLPLYTVYFVGHFSPSLKRAQKHKKGNASEALSAWKGLEGSG